MMVKKRNVKRAKVKGVEEEIKPSGLKHKQFWGLFALVFLLSILAILNSLDDVNVTGHATVQTIAFIQGGQELIFEVKDITGMKQATIQLVEDVKGGKIIFEKDENIAFDRSYFSKFTVSSTEEEKYGEMVFLLKINENELYGEGIARKDLGLYSNGEELVTTFIETKEGFLYYEATSQEFGEFVIGKKEVGIVVEEIEEVKEKPVVTGDTSEQKQVEEPKDGFLSGILNFFRNVFN